MKNEIKSSKKRKMMIVIKRTLVVAAFTVAGILYVSESNEEDVYIRHGQETTAGFTAAKEGVTGEVDSTDMSEKTASGLLTEKADTVGAEISRDKQQGSAAGEDKETGKTDSANLEKSDKITETLTSVNLKTNINTADEQELTALNGIGPAKANKIIRFREEHGEFSSIEELMLVPGIKEGTFGKIKDSITVR